MERIKIVAIVGEAGSGKDSLAEALMDQLQDENFKVHEIISYTTRPKRDYEINGVDYHFVDAGTLAGLIIEDKMLEAAEFNGWIYGTCIEDLEEDAINVGVFNPEGIESLSQDPRINMCIIQCSCNEKDRLLRQLNRELDPNVDEIIRRFHADRRDFSNFDINNYSNRTVIIPTDKGNSVSEEAALVVDYVRYWAKNDN